MSKPTLKDAIYEWMPAIDKAVSISQPSIFDRLLPAALIFVDEAVTDSNFNSKEELLQSEGFDKGIVPIINDWYWETYGELARKPDSNKFLSGIVCPFGQQVLIKIPTTTSKIEEVGKTAWLKFPDSLEKDEKINDMAQTPIKLESLEPAMLGVLMSDFSETVSLSRSINLDFMAANNLDQSHRDMASGIWGHFEKAILDILSFEDSKASVGCWELHLAIEKALKVYLHQKDGGKHRGHNLKELGHLVKNHTQDIDLTTIDSLPSDQDAIQLRYSEKIRSVADATGYYKTALRIVAETSKELSRDYRFNNASFLIKVAPWAR